MSHGKEIGESLEMIYGDDGKIGQIGIIGQIGRIKEIKGTLSEVRKFFSMLEPFIGSKKASTFAEASADSVPNKKKACVLNRK